MGILRCDSTFISSLAEKYGVERSFEDEILHKYEHSLELQVPFMSALCPQATIAPILVGSFYEMVRQDKQPEDFSEYNEFAAALTETISERLSAGGKVSFLAGVDMAHVGQTFGDLKPLTPEFMEHVAERDALYLKALSQQNKEMLFSHIVEDGDARRICGFPTMYTLLDVCDRLGLRYTSELIDYSQAVDYSTDCAVTFAAMSFYLE
jgi:AmmeMemoRadiSam system protein B